MSIIETNVEKQKNSKKIWQIFGILLDIINISMASQTIIVFFIPMLSFSRLLCSSILCMIYPTTTLAEELEWKILIFIFLYIIFISFSLLNMLIKQNIIIMKRKKVFKIIYTILFILNIIVFTWINLCLYQANAAF